MDMNTLKCIILSAVKHRPTENVLRPLTWSICGGTSTGFMRFGWGCQGNRTGWIHGQLMAEMERNLSNYLTQNHHDKENTVKSNIIVLIEAHSCIVSIQTRYQGIKYSYFTWGTISQRLLLVAPRNDRQKVHVHKTNTKPTHKNGNERITQSKYAIEWLVSFM